LQLADKGCHLALVDVSRKGMQDTRKKIANKNIKVTQHVTDVSDADAMAALAEDVAARTILKAVRKDKMRVVVGTDAAFFESAKRALPESVHKLFLLMPRQGPRAATRQEENK
jgi:short-subunit dehydrogenase